MKKCCVMVLLALVVTACSVLIGNCQRASVEMDGARQTQEVCR